MMLNMMTNLTKALENLGRNTVNSITLPAQGILTCDFVEKTIKTAFVQYPCHKVSKSNSLPIRIQGQGIRLILLVTHNPSWRNHPNFSWTNQINVQNPSFQPNQPQSNFSNQVSSPRPYQPPH
ncbi:hypothetical protein ACH5RR_001427 [Cinchona calisaya]|uniref:Uncharacterized protein n=1 Tax=Cinchona calisaya TaxID=153742 RepID=A0ABD3B3T4_9GENT